MYLIGYAWVMDLLGALKEARVLAGLSQAELARRAETSRLTFLAVVDGALLIDLWRELVLPRAVRAAWAPLIDEALDAEACVPVLG